MKSLYAVSAVFTSGYCCLNSTLVPRSLPSAGYAAVSTETLNDHLFTHPTGELVAPLGQQLPFSLID